MIKLQDLLDTHVAQIIAIEHAAHSHPWSDATILSSIASKRTSVVGAFIDDQLAGYAVFDCVVDEANLQNISVSPAYQRRGVGRTLISEIFNRYPRAQNVFLEVRESNHIAIALYHSMGFAELGIRRNYYPVLGGLREDAVLMALPRI
jgi:ribosomal-protein-alanine N-acetyltransferase